MPEDMVALRCKYCGAPLGADDLKDDSPYVTCQSCGTTQQRVDAKAYLDQLMGQVRSWLNKAVPGGAAMGMNSSVDAVARHNIYINNVQPKIDSEFGDYKFGLVSMLSHVMMVMPFSVDASLRPSHTSEKAFEFGAKLKEVEPLAVSDDTAASLTEASGATDAYAVLINNSKLLAEDKPGRYVLMFNNFTTAANDFASMRGYEPAASRFAGLALLAQGCESLLNGDAAGAYGHFEAGSAKLKEAKASLIGNMKVPIMGPALENEIKMGETLTQLANYVNSMGGTKEVFEAVRKIMTYTYPDTGQWGYMFKIPARTGKILSAMGDAARARTGEASINVAKGDGDILLPFWYVKLNYSFETGSLWKKKSVTVSEDLLVAADFTIDTGCLNNPRTAVTDVFRNASSPGFLEKLSGNQSSISDGAGIGKLVEGAGPAGTSGRRVVVPLSTKEEAEKLAEEYVRGSASANKQLRLSNPDVKGLVYVPFATAGNGVRASGLGLVPEHTASLDLSRVVVL